MDDLKQKSRHHSLTRTSPLGENFVGTCTLCGKPNLTVANMMEVCENPFGATTEEVLTQALTKRSPWTKH